MKVNSIVFVFLLASLVFFTAAHFLPISKIKSLTTVGDTSEIDSREPSLLDIEEVLASYTQRLLFISNDNINLSVLQEKPMEHTQWSPLDYELIGVSKTSGNKIGWFQQKATGSLVSARQNDVLGEWTLELLSKTEARLRLNDETVSLKLFLGQQKR